MEVGRQQRARLVGEHAHAIEMHRQAQSHTGSMGRLA